ncbi:MAG TPA: nuclear transport factor 2 family protein [Ktedonobacterales bacterium]
MSERLDTAAIARAFTEAWSSHDMETAAGYLAEDVTFDGPINHSSGRQAYIEGLSAFAQRVSHLKIIAALGDDTQAMIVYELTTGPLTATYAERLTFSDGKIQTDQLIFDSYPMRQGQ